jgi:hypothetical protein
VFGRSKFPRINKNYNVSYKCIEKGQFEDHPISSLAVNISGGGICFEANEKLKKGSIVALEINAKNLESSILGLARVVWCKLRGDRYEIGAEFWWVGWRDNETQNNIADYIATKTIEARATV